ncbi:MAG: zinc ribbon domain-containing protein [Terracidiphilus sp.]|nr:zinc ribbon domain-containing protein [Terracidiphilus sp.]MDR3776346.1 zinc ribbon domain-containing protein [Terracidiphilus sp.]
MEITCTRCHQAIQAENCYCPACGLPQLVYAPDGAPGQALPERLNEPVRDASSVDWKPGLRAALLLAIPAGLLSSGLSPVGVFGLFWMSAAAAWAVVLYVRSQKPAWITIGAGARIGLVTGLLAGWLAFSISGGTLFVERYVLHQSSQIDGEWKTRVDTSQQLTQQWTAGMNTADAAQAQATKTQIQNFMLSPEGHAGFESFGYTINAIFLLLFAAGGGALGARLLARNRRPEI